jgi:hypothetical protein
LCVLEVGFIGHFINDNGFGFEVAWQNGRTPSYDPCFPQGN